MLISSIEILKNYIAAIVGSDFAKYNQCMTDAENWLRKEITGSALFDVIEMPGNVKLLGYCRAVVAYKGYGDGIPTFDLVETENGFAVASNQNLAPASAQRVAALQQSMYAKLDEAIEDLLDYLEETPDLHDEWKGSPVYSLLSDLYITTVKELRRYVVYTGSRRDFIRLKPDFMNAINLTIAPVISEELSDEIIEELRDGDLTPANKAILENLRFALCNLALKQNDTGQAYLMRVRRVLFANPDSYPAFKASDIYQNYLASLEVAGINNSDSPLFFAGL